MNFGLRFSSSGEGGSCRSPEMSCYYYHDSGTKASFYLLYLSCSLVPCLLRAMLSPKSVQRRGLILKYLDLGGNSRKLGHNVIFDTANAARLAQLLYALRVDDATPEDEVGEIKDMKTMIKKYSTFDKHVPGSSPAPEGHVVVLTGSTGSLGAHVLASLLARSDVRNVYCLVRGEDPRERVLEALRRRRLKVPEMKALVAFTSDLSRKDLGLSPEIFSKLQNETTTIIHRYVSYSCYVP